MAIVHDQETLEPLDGVTSTYELARIAAATSRPITDVAEQHRSGDREPYGPVIEERRILAPIDHPDPAHLMVSGTGLDHTGSAMARDVMHGGTGAATTATPPVGSGPTPREDGEDPHETDSIRMFRLGLEGGKPEPGRIGAAPEWFYKGDGSTIVPPEQPLELPGWAGDGGEEAEIVAIYLIAGNGRPRRVGYAVGNEYADHVIERRNYLYLAHSKLRQCSFGPELLLGDLPDDLRGRVQVRRGEQVVWEDRFATGEANMTHSLANLEHHHFKYEAHRRPWDVHCHFIGAATLSAGAGIRCQSGDWFEISAPGFGRPLRNQLGGRELESRISVEPL